MVSSALSLFKALSDETRLRLMAVLSVYELSVNELVSLMNMGQSRISRHLKILSDAGLLQFRRDGLWVFYSFPAEGDVRSFWLAIREYVQGSQDLQQVIKSDLLLAAGIVQERALRSRQFFDSIAEDWDEISREMLAGFDLPARIIELAPESALGVDLGCGTGYMLECLLNKFKRVIGVDGSPQMLELARRRLAPFGERVSLRIGELEHLPLADREADFALISMVLHHLEAPRAAIGEIERALAPGGNLIIADLLKHKNEEMRSKYGDRWLGFELEELEAMLGGFKKIKTEIHSLKNGLEAVIILARRRN
ncbi:MAG: ArsR family transcriptional regulator [Desulfovibrionaceae bacterium]|nr:ArsR family transcriptional regulator [Desulfovibrionaceae bacterium]